MKLAAVISPTLMACAIILMVVAPARACRYNVRDVGFVDHGEPGYRLCLLTDADTPVDLVETIEQVSYAVLLDSNVELEVVRVDRQEDHPAVGAMGQCDIRPLPALMMMSPRGEVCTVPLEVDGKDVRQAAWRCLERAVTSPLRERLSQAVASSYCVVLWVASTDEAKNRRAAKEIDAAVQDIAGMMGQLPKQIHGKPRAVRIGVDDARDNAVLLWSLGVEPDAATGPWAFVVYGKGRWIGPRFADEAITQDGLVGVMGLVGQSCECELDRRDMLGVRLPMRWDDRARQASAKNLGFDPDNPMVRLEIRKILAMGASVREQGKADPLDGLMGYSEQIVTADGPGGLIGQDEPRRDGARGAARDRPAGDRASASVGALRTPPRAARADSSGEATTPAASSARAPEQAAAAQAGPRQPPLTGLEPPRPSFLATWAVIGAVAVIIIGGSIAIAIKAQRRYA